MENVSLWIRGASCHRNRALAHYPNQNFPPIFRDGQSSQTTQALKRANVSKIKQMESICLPFDENFQYYYFLFKKYNFFKICNIWKDLMKTFNILTSDLRNKMSMIFSKFVIFVGFPNVWNTNALAFNGEKRLSFQLCYLSLTMASLTSLSS